MFSYSKGYYVSPPDDQYLKFKNRCSLLGRNKTYMYNIIIPAQWEFGKWHPGWGQEYRKAFFTVWWFFNDIGFPFALFRCGNLSILEYSSKWLVCHTEEGGGMAACSGGGGSLMTHSAGLLAL